MTDPKTELDELRALQQEAGEKRARRQRARPKSDPAAAPRSATVEERSEEERPAEEAASEAQPPEWEQTLQDLAAHLEDAVTEIEEATREHPALALLAAFTIGVVVGQLFSRR